MYWNALNWLETSPIGAAINAGLWWFPSLEAIHVIAAALVVGCIAWLDFRLLWLRSRDIAVTRLSAHTLPLVWTAFAIAVVTGVLLFLSQATRYGTSAPFLIKMGLLVLAGINMAVFHRLASRRIREWDEGRPPAGDARLAGALSLIFWVGVVICGRWIGFAG